MKKVFYPIAGLVVVAVIILAYVFLNKKQAPKPVESHPYNFSGPCPGETKTMKMTDSLMDGVIANGDSYKLISDYYWCNPVKKGDVVLLRFSHSLDPVVRKVYAVPGDEFKVYFNKKQNFWNVDVNGETVKLHKEPYFFGAGSADTPPPLKLLEVSREGTLLDREIIVFSQTAPGSKDSGTLGVVNLNDVVGKVEIDEKENKEKLEPSPTKKNETVSASPKAKKKED